MEAGIQRDQRGGGKTQGAYKTPTLASVQWTSSLRLPPTRNTQSCHFPFVCAVAWTSVFPNCLIFVHVREQTG